MQVRLKKSVSDFFSNENFPTRNLGCTPLHNAVIRGHYDMIDVLMENGADINTTDKLGKNTLTPALARLDIAYAGGWSQ